MKKYLSILIVIGLFTTPPLFAQTTDEQSEQSPSFLEKVAEAWRTPLNYLLQPQRVAQSAATALSQTSVSPASVKTPTVKTQTAVTNTNVAGAELSVPFPKPPTDGYTVPPNPTTQTQTTLATTTGCGQTLTPLGQKNETIRCDGTKWVKAKNLLNDGTNVGIGANPFIESKLFVSNTDDVGVFGHSDKKTGVIGSGYVGVTGYGDQQNNGGIGVMGQGGLYGVRGIGVNLVGAIGVEGFSLSGPGVVGISSAENFGVGVSGGASSNSGVGVSGQVQNDDGAAIFAAQIGNGYGIYQKGHNAKNYFGGSVLISNDPPLPVQGYSLAVVNVEPTHSAIYGQSDSGIAVRAQIANESGSQGGIGIAAAVNDVFSTAILAHQPSSGLGIKQTGTTARNDFEGTLSVGYEGAGNLTPGVKLQTNGGIKIATNQTAPACAETTRGTFWFVKGGSGVPDTAQVCAKDAVGAYAWMKLF